MLIYIQYYTDFHLLAALSAIEIKAQKVVLVGPKTRMSGFVLDKLKAEHLVADPRRPKIGFLKLVFRLICAEKDNSCIVISPFVFPLYLYSLTLRKGYYPGEFVRTDEGVGSYATVDHMFQSMRRAYPDGSRVITYFQATYKVFITSLTRWAKLCREQYIFKIDGSFDEAAVDRFRENINLLGREDYLNDKLVYISQPHTEAAFSCPADYIRFVKSISTHFDDKPMIVKRHPADAFDYSAYGFEVLEELPLEMYSLRGSVIVGYSSTALLTSKIVGGADKVYYLQGAEIDKSYNGLSDFNKFLFRKYLEPLYA